MCSKICFVALEMNAVFIVAQCPSQCTYPTNGVEAQSVEAKAVAVITQFPSEIYEVAELELHSKHPSY